VQIYPLDAEQSCSSQRH